MFSLNPYKIIILQREEQIILFWLKTSQRRQALQAPFIFKFPNYYPTKRNDLEKSLKTLFFVIPAKAGIQGFL